MSAGTPFGRRPFFLLIGLGALLGTSPVPVPVSVSNETGGAVRARYDDSEWMTIPDGETRGVATFGHGGLCSPPNRWLPESFAHIEIEFANGTTRVLGREAFLREAEWGPGASWTLHIQRVPR